MSPHAHSHLFCARRLLALTTSAVLLAAPVLSAPTAAAAGATTGGSGLAPSPAGSSPSSSSVVNVNAVVSAGGDGMKVQTVKGAVTGRKLAFSGSAPKSDANRSVEIQFTATPKQTGSWKNATKATVRATGGFAGSWKPSVSGQLALRAELLPKSPAPGSSSAHGASVSAPAHTSTLTVDVFKSSKATLYGPGLWGHETACGETLKKTTIGVANRTLKCGTKVAIDYDGRVIEASVIDRGPYANGASWDLTMATAKKLGITSTATIATLAPAPK